MGIRAGKKEMWSLTWERRSMTRGMCGFRLTRQASGQRSTFNYAIFVVDCRAAKDFLLAWFGNRGSGWWEEVETDATGWGGSVRTRVTRLVGKRTPCKLGLRSPRRGNCLPPLLQPTATTRSTAPTSIPSTVIPVFTSTSPSMAGCSIHPTVLHIPGAARSWRFRI